MHDAAGTHDGLVHPPVMRHHLDRTSGLKQFFSSLIKYHGVAATNIFHQRILETWRFSE